LILLGCFDTERQALATAFQTVSLVAASRCRQN